MNVGKTYLSPSNANCERQRNTGEPILYAIPAPKEVGNRLLCLCKKVEWVQDEVHHVLYTPICKDEASCLLSDPRIVNVLSNPLAGSNLLRATDNGGIVGVPQAIGCIKQLASNKSNGGLITPIIDETDKGQKNSTGFDVCRKTTISEPLKENQKYDEEFNLELRDSDICRTSPVSVSHPVLPRIESVYSLASDIGLSSSTYEPPEDSISINGHINGGHKPTSVLDLRNSKSTELEKSSATKENVSVELKKSTPISCTNGSLKMKFRWNKRWKIERASCIYNTSVAEGNTDKIATKHIAMNNHQFVYLSSMTDEDIAKLKPKCSTDASTCSIVTMKRKVPWVIIHKLGIDYLRQVKGNENS